MIIRDAETQRAAIVDASGNLQAIIDDTTALDVQSTDGVRVIHTDVQAAQDGLIALLASVYSPAGAEDVLYFENNDADKCVIEEIILSCDTAMKFEIAEVTGTPGGSTLTASSGELGTVIGPGYTAYGGASVTGLTPGNVFRAVELGAGSVFVLDPELILGNNDDFVISVDTAGAIAVSIKVRWLA